jgi:hypothetical protein
MRFVTHGGSALRRDNRDHGLPQCEMSLLMWWTVPAPGSELP